MREQSKTLTLTMDNVNDYMTASNVSLAVSLLGVDMVIRQYTQPQNGYARLNNQALSRLYPNTQITPIRIEYNNILGYWYCNNNCYAALEINNQTIGERQVIPETNTTESMEMKRSIDVIDGVEAQTLLNSLTYDNCNVTLHSYLDKGTFTSGQVITQAPSFTFWYNTYSVANPLYVGQPVEGAETIPTQSEVFDSISVNIPGGTGINAMEVWEQGTVEFSAHLTDKGKFIGWFAQREDGQYDQATPLSTQLTYTISDVQEDIGPIVAVGTISPYAITVNHESLSASMINHNEVILNANLEPWQYFGGWYKDPNFTQLISFSNPLIASITSDSAFYGQIYTIEPQISISPKRANTAVQIKQLYCGNHPIVYNTQGWSYSPHILTSTFNKSLLSEPASTTQVEPIDCTDWCVTDYILVPPNIQSCYLNAGIAHNNFACMYGYDEDYNYINAWSANDNPCSIIDFSNWPNLKYVRISLSMNNLSSCQFNVVDTNDITYNIL